MTAMTTRTPKEIARETHSRYYSAGSYANDRYAWTIRTFLPGSQSKSILEVGCGSGCLLELLKPANQVVGVDVAADGIDACATRGSRHTASTPLANLCRFLTSRSISSFAWKPSST